MTPDRLQLTIETTSPEETEEAGEMIGRRIKEGEIIALEGGLGAGKTVLIRGLARGLEIPEDEISSPTFVFLHEHRGRLPLAHIDLFRVESPSNVADLGIHDYLEGSWVMAIEWAEKAADFLPGNRLTIHISDAETDRRRLTISTENPSHEAILKELRERFCALTPDHGDR